MKKPNQLIHSVFMLSAALTMSAPGGISGPYSAEQPALFEARESSARNSGGLVHELAPHSVVVIEFRNP